MKDLLEKAIELYGLDGVHPAAEIMPFMGEDEFNGLVEDAEKNGFQNAVKVTKDRLLIDGRNRICASIVLEKDVRIEEFTPSDPIQYVLSENLERRHLSSQQKAAIAIEAEDLYQLLAEQAKQAQGTRADLLVQDDANFSEKIHESSKPEPKPQERRTDTKLAKAFGTNQNYVAKAKKVKDHAPELLPEVAAGNVDLNEAAKVAAQRKKETTGQLQEVGSKISTGLQPDVNDFTAAKVDGKVTIIPKLALEPTAGPSSESALPPEPESNPIETINQNGYTIHIWHNKPQSPPSFNTANESIDWAWSTWNPVTGCLHGCNYCYAERIATNERMAKVYPMGFEPVFHPYRLDAPKNAHQFTEQEIIKKAQERRLDLEQAKLWAKNVFVCSMADLFGKWVPDDWIMRVFDSVIKYDQWNYLFLTKYPQRLQEIGEKLGGSFPDNCWVGTTVDEQKRVRIAQEAFANIKAPVKWLSLEPLLTNLEFTDLGMFDLVAIGAETDGSPYCNSCGQVDPKRIKFTAPWEWVENILWQARKSGTAFYLKENLKCRPKELPFVKSVEVDDEEW
jgi:protein gp37